MRTTLEDHSPPLAATERFASADRHLKLQRLLVPVDFTTATLPALHFASTLAERFGSVGFEPVLIRVGACFRKGSCASV